MSGKGQGGQGPPGNGQKTLVAFAKSSSHKPPPTKKAAVDKRGIADVSDASSSNNSMNLQNQLDVMTESLEGLKEDMKRAINKDDIETIIVQAITKTMADMEKRMMQKMEAKIKETTKELSERITSLEFDNKQLNQKLMESNAEKKKQIEDLEERVTQNEIRSKEANRRSNYNEQYSRKNNFKIMDLSGDTKETEDELKEKVTELLKKKGVNLAKEEIVAIHRIPTKKGQVRPVLVKTVNNNTKSKVMKARKAMKEAGNRLVDDVTALNSGLINRLLTHTQIESAWFFNGSVYGLTGYDERLKFDIYDNIDAGIAAYRERVLMNSNGKPSGNPRPFRK